MWLFVISENEYLHVIEMPIEVRNLPARHALTEEVPESAKVRLRGAGRALFKTIILKNFTSDFNVPILLPPMPSIWVCLCWASALVKSSDL